MKPTQQEIIDVAREQATRYTNRHYPEQTVFTFTQDKLEEFANLLLERFGAGAGGGEPVAWMYFDSDGDAIFGHPNGYRPDDAVPVYAHPSPSDLRAEYLRGLGEGFKEGWIECSKWAQRVDLIADIGSPSYEACVSAVKALKGKQ